jgi:hypothetical protein
MPIILELDASQSPIAIDLLVEQGFGSGGVSSITGLIEAGSNITLTGEGTTASPYLVALSTTISVASLTTAATVYANGATFGYNNSAAASNHRGALGLGEFALLNNDGSAGLDVSSVSAGGSVGCDTVNANTGNIASISVSTSTAFGNNVAFTYGTNSASNHRTALGLGSFATLDTDDTASLVSLGGLTLTYDIAAENGTFTSNVSAAQVTATRYQTGNNIVTEVDDFTVTEATHAGAYVNLNKTSSPQLITMPASGIATGRQGIMRRVTTQPIQFSGAGTVQNGSNIVDVPVGGCFGWKCTGVGTYDFI